MTPTRLLPVALLTLAAGCGPLVVPAVRRLPPDEQAVVDASWDNMLAPTDRLDRQTLLDAVVAFQLIHAGVDRLTMRSEKAFAGGSVVMTVRFDRADPSADGFGVDVFDRRGRHVRSERFSNDEVFEASRALWDTGVPVRVNIGPTSGPATGPATRPSTAPTTEPDEPLSPRQLRVLAATRPGGTTMPAAGR